MISDILALRIAEERSPAEERFVRDAADVLREHACDRTTAAAIEDAADRVEEISNTFLRRRRTRDLVAATQRLLTRNGFGVVWADGYVIAVIPDEASLAGA